MSLWATAGETHPGVRRPMNEDALIMRPEIGLWAVADGMGGHAAGDLASRAITEALAAIDGDACLAGRVDVVDDALCEVNASLRDYARTSQGGTVGSTAVVMLAAGESGVVLWAGDSRLYRLRSARLEQITRDHNPVADLLDEGAVSEAEALATETNVITRAVGGQADLHLDVAVFDIAPGDTFLLCSDGMYRELRAADIVERLAAARVEDAVARLLETCLERGARDNVSIVVSRWRGR